MLTVRELSPRDRPRERLARSGADGLSDVELIATLLGTGTGTRDVLSLAREVLNVIDRSWPSTSAQDLRQVRGIGPAKAALLLAALAFARRRIRPQGSKVREASDVMPLVQHLADRRQEHFVCVSLNGAHEVITTRVVTIGLVNATQVHPREVFADAIADRACAVVVAHNHPSGNLQPSEEDKRVTKLLRDAGGILGITLLDHIIFSRNGFYSFAEHGL